MPKVRCVDCGHQWQSTVNQDGPRRCRACTKKSRQANQRPGRIKEQAATYGATLEHVGVRELKANPGELLTRLEETPDMEIIITRYGKAAAKLISMFGKIREVPWAHRGSLRGSWSNRPDLTDEDFADAKRIWESKLGA